MFRYQPDLTADQLASSSDENMKIDMEERTVNDSFELLMLFKPKSSLPTRGSSRLVNYATLVVGKSLDSHTLALVFVQFICISLSSFPTAHAPCMLIIINVNRL